MTSQTRTDASASNQTPLKNKEHALTRFGIDPNKIIHDQGRYWMTAEQLGIALGYRNPRQSITNLINRHKKELRPFIGEIKLVSPCSQDGRGGGLQETTIIDTDGQYRVALFANTPKSEKFRTFIVNMLKALERQEFVHISQIEHWRKELIELKISKHLNSSGSMGWKKYNKMVRYRKMGLTQRETAKLIDVSRDTIQHYERITRQYELKLIPGGAS